VSLRALAIFSDPIFGWNPEDQRRVFVENIIVDRSQGQTGAKACACCASAVDAASSHAKLAKNPHLNFYCACACAGRAKRRGESTA
jgi:hypothetical protein